MPSMAVNGIDLYYEETGSGPPVLLISALSGNTLDWDMLQPALATRFRIIAFDNRGAGRSSAQLARIPRGRWPMMRLHCWSILASSAPMSLGFRWAA